MYTQDGVLLLPKRVPKTLAVYLDLGSFKVNLSLAEMRLFETTEEGHVNA